MPQDDAYLVISVLGEDQPGIVDRLSGLIYAHDCNISDSRMAVLGGEFAVILLVEGAAARVADLEPALQELAQHHGLTLTSRRTRARRPGSDTLPYVIRAVALDHPGIVHRLAHFFASRGINIEQLDTERYAAAHTGAPLFAIHLRVSIPAGLRIAELREAFLDFCDELNIDATMEPASRPA